MKRGKRDSLDAIFRPRSVAIVGASNNPRRWGYHTLTNMLLSGYRHPDLSHQPDISITEKIQTNLKCGPVIAAILANRNITSEENARWFLKPSFASIKPPDSIKDIDTAVNRIYSAIINHEKY